MQAESSNELASQPQQKTLEDNDKYYFQGGTFRAVDDTNFDTFRVSVFESKSYPALSINEGIDENDISLDLKKPNNSTIIEEQKNANDETALDTSIVSNTNHNDKKTDQATVDHLAQSYRENRKYKIYWKIFTILLAFGLAGYLGVEVFVLNELVKGKTSRQEKSRTIQYFMDSFAKNENVLYTNIYMNMIVFIFGMIAIVYSAIILIVEYDQPWKWMRGIHKKIARYLYLIFLFTYLLGGLVQTIYVIANRRDTTINRGWTFFGYMVAKGVLIYVNYSSFRKCELFKYMQTEIFKDAMNIKNLKLDGGNQDLESNWQKIYDSDEDDDDDYLEVDLSEIIQGRPEEGQANKNTAVDPGSIVVQNTPSK